MDRYRDRLDRATYDGDEPVGVGVDRGEGNYDGWIWIPERLFGRMHHLANAYELHVLNGLDLYGRNALTREQVETLADELEFIGAVVDDAALKGALEALHTIALDVARQPVRSVLVIEGP